MDGEEEVLGSHTYALSLCFGTLFSGREREMTHWPGSPAKAVNSDGMMFESSGTE